MFDNTETQISGFENGTCAVGLADWLDVINPQAATYGLVTAIGPTTGVASLRNSVATTAGTLTFTAPPLTFQATLGTSAPIPTLSQWALILLGLALTCVAVYFLRGRTLLSR